MRHPKWHYSLVVEQSAGAASASRKVRLVNLRFRSLLSISLVAATLLSACGNSDSSPDPTASAAVFNEADVAFTKAMIPHHKQAVEMATIALGPAIGAGQEVVDLATRIQSAQQPEIDLMTAWLVGWGEKPHDMNHMDDTADMKGMQGMMSADDMSAMSVLSGPAFDARWYEMMILHHEGAMAMAEVVKASGQNADVALLAEEIIAAQQAEIVEMRALLGP